MNYQVLILFLAYVVLIVSLGYFRPEGKHAKYLIRKSVHLVTGLVVFYLTFRISRQTLLIVFIAGTIFSFLTYFIRKFNYIHVTGESSWGTLFYPLGILSSFLVLYDLPLYYFQISLLFLAISDTVANLGGYLVRGNPPFAILSEKKTPVGIVGFALTALIISLILLPGTGSYPLVFMLLTVVCAIHFEIISHKGSDNLAIPFGTALFFYVTHGKDIDTLWIIAVILFMGLISILLYRAGILTRKGALAAHLLGVYLFGILGPGWGIPVAFFFVTSVIFTKINGWVNRKQQGAGRRNIWQVMANIAAGLVFSMGFLISSQPIFIYLFISVVAAVTADTWASEVGPVFHRKCFSLSGWRTAASGVSGGISYAGTLAAFAGAFLVALVAWTGLFPGMDFQMILILTLSGFLASFVDSMLGAFVEPHLDNMDYFIRGTGSESISPNDVVNVLASFTAPLFVLLLNFFLN
jgi:uncharacterized protein (TIGR00297 family)